MKDARKSLFAAFSLLKIVILIEISIKQVNKCQNIHYFKCKTNQKESIITHF